MQVPCPSSFIQMPYIPIRCDVIPPPLPAVTDPLPDVQRQYEQKAKTEKLKSKGENKTNHGGFFWRNS